MKNTIVSALVFAGLMLAAVFGLKYLAAHGFVAGDAKALSNRIIQVSMGLFIAWMANIAPKHLTPLDHQIVDPSEAQSAARFGAIILMIAGLIYALAWLLAPPMLALFISVSAIGVAAVIILVRAIMKFGAFRPKA